jgi:hypothetical protein
MRWKLPYKLLGATLNLGDAEPSKTTNCDLMKMSP